MDQHRNDSHQTGPYFSHYSPAADQPMAVVVGGEANATGYNTTASGVIDNVVEKLPGATIAEGEVTFDAVGQSAGHGGATAHTDAFVDVTGADFLFEVEIHAAGHGLGGAWSETEIEYVAIDIPNWRPPGGHTITDVVMLNLNHAGPPANDMGALSGNVATVLANADAFGQNTSTSTLTQAHTVEHHQSFVSGMAFSVA